MEERFMLTTVDNPFDPFNDFTSWYKFDCDKGYNTASRIARIADINSEMSQKEVDDEMERVIDFILKHEMVIDYVKVNEKQAASVANV